MKKVCVMGAGTMGLDVAQVFATKGFEVTVRDISDEILDAAKAKLIKGLDKKVAKGKMTEEAKEAILGNMSFTTDLKALADMDLIVEAILGAHGYQEERFRRTGYHLQARDDFASNTSSLSITAIATATKRQDKFIGMHFFNPATVMKLVEVIRGAHTSDETFEIIKNLSVEIGKTPVEVAEAPGFVVNKILVPLMQ